MSAYWERLTQDRISRRRALQGTAALGAGAAGLALLGCGGNDSGGDSGVSSGSIHTPQDTTAQAKPGGALRSVSAIDAITFDILSTSALGTIVFAGYAYPRLVKTAITKYPAIPNQANVASG